MPSIRPSGVNIERSFGKHHPDTAHDVRTVLAVSITPQYASPLLACVCVGVRYLSFT